MSQIGTSEADRMAQAVEARIKAIAQQVYKEVPSDRELEGLVISKDSQNKYTVKINNATYKNIMQERSLGEIKPNTIVKVKVPNNQMNNAYICGVVDGTITTYSNGGGGGGTAVNVVDRLDSTSITEALSANQGRILNDKIKNNITSIEELSSDFNFSTINGKFIKDNPVLTAADVGALPSTTVIPEGVKLYTELGQNTDGAVTQKTVTNAITEETTARELAIGNLNTSLTNKIDAKYTKPENGIPKSDLASVVQISLDKADNALPNTTKYGASLELSINNTTYVVTAQLKDQNGDNLGAAQTIDLPLESVVVSGSYDSENKRVVLTLKDGSTIAFSVADLVSGLASQSSLDQTNTNLNNLTTRVYNAETNISKKVDKVEGKGLSTNDFTTAYKTKLDGLENYDDTAVRDLINDKYTKPSTGIPKTDLASAVQTSLDKADSALQSVPSEYITETQLNAKNYTDKTYVDGQIDTRASQKDLETAQGQISSLQGNVSTLQTDYTSLSNTKADKTEVSAGVNEAKTYTNTEIQKVRGTGGESLTLAGLNSAIATNSQEIGNFETGLDNVRKDITDLNNNKVDREAGKGLSSNDFTTAYINQIATNEGNIREINTNIGTIQGNITSLQNAKADKSEIPDVSDFITSTVNNLTNYYLKSETYSKQEVNNLIGSITSISFEVVSALPTAPSGNIIYLLPKTASTNDVYEEYIYVNNSWEKIGDTSVDLSNYYNKTEVDTKLGEKLNLSGGTLTGSLKMASAELTGYLKMATGTNNAIVYGTSRKNVIEVSSTTESDGTTRTITMGNSDDYLKLKGKSLTFNGGGVATLNDLNNSINNAKLTIKQNGTEIGSFTSNAIEDVEVNIETGESVKLYDSIGQNTDGAMTQKAVSDKLTDLDTNLSWVQNSALPLKADKTELNNKVEFKEVDELNINPNIQSQINEINEKIENKLGMGLTRLYNSGGTTTGTINLGDVSQYTILHFCMADNNGVKQQSNFITETLTNGSAIGLYGYDNLYINISVSGSLTNLTLNIAGRNNLTLYSIYGIKL